MAFGLMPSELLPFVILEKVFWFLLLVFFFFFFFFLFFFVFLNNFRNFFIFCINIDIDDFLLLDKNKGLGINSFTIVSLSNS